MEFLNVARRAVRRFVKQYAVWLNDVTKGKLRPDDITMIGFLMHFVIAYFIAVNDFLAAAVLLIIFGLFDALDGELARLQGRSSVYGMLLDATTDRLKEVAIYIGAAVALGGSQTAAAWCVAACGVSLCVSYVKAKGEATLMAKGDQHITHHKLNYIFQDGIMAFEVRMAVIIVGLLFHVLLWAIIVVTIGGLLTFVKRFRRIAKELQS